MCQGVAAGRDTGCCGPEQAREPAALACVCPALSHGFLQESPLFRHRFDPYVRSQASEKPLWKPFFPISPQQACKVPKSPPFNGQETDSERLSNFFNQHPPYALPVPQLTWVIKIELALQGFGLLLWREDTVEAILAQDDHLLLAIVHLVLSQKLHNLSTNGRLWGEKRTPQTTGWGPVTKLTVCAPSKGLWKEERKGYHLGRWVRGREAMSAEKEFRGPQVSSPHPAP